MRMEAGKLLELFETVVDDGAEAGAAEDGRRPASQQRRGSEQIRELATGTRTRHIDAAQITRKEDAPIGGLFQDALGAEWVDNCVKFRHVRRRRVKEACNRLDVFVGDFDRGLPATIGAGAAVDLLRDVLGDVAQRVVGRVMRGQMSAEFDVLVLFRRRKAANPNEVSDHAFSIPPAIYRARIRKEMSPIV